MKRARHIVYIAIRSVSPLLVLSISAAIFIAVFASAAKIPKCYNPYRPDGSLKPVSIKIEWDNPDLEDKTREKMCSRMLVKLVAGSKEIKMAKGEKTAVISTEDYLALWEVMYKVKVWKLPVNALTVPRP